MIFAGAYLAHIQDVTTECRRKKLNDTERERERESKKPRLRQTDRETDEAGPWRRPGADLGAYTPEQAGAHLRRILQEDTCGQVRRIPSLKDVAGPALEHRLKIRHHVSL